MQAQPDTTKSEKAVPIPRGELRINPKLNPRFIFTVSGLEGLGASLRKGQVEPCIVRRAKDGKGYEVGAGARRLKAAELEKLPELLCIVRELSDEDMLSMSLAENGDREDLHPLEEGAAFERLLLGVNEGGVVVKPRSADQIAELRGKPKGYVLGRIRLHADLGPKVREAFVTGRLGNGDAGAEVARAFLAAGSKEQQDKALEAVIRSRGPEEKLDVAVVRNVVRTRFLLRLADARFPLGEDRLVPGALPCGKCPKNSANQPDLFEGVKGDALCTDGACFDAKKKAHVARALAEAKGGGQEEVKPREAKIAWAQAAIGPSAWVPADQPLAGLDEKGRTLDALLGREKVARGYAVDEQGWARSLVRRADAAGALRRAGHGPIADRLEEAVRPKAPEKAPDEAGRAKVAEAVTRLLLAVERRAVAPRSEPERKALLAVVGHLAEQALPETLVAVVRRRGLDDAGAKGSVRGRARAMVVGAAASMKGAHLLGLAVELVVVHGALDQLSLKPKERGTKPLWALLDAYGVEVAARAAPRAKALGKKLAKKKPAKKAGK